MRCLLQCNTPYPPIPLQLRKCYDADGNAVSSCVGKGGVLRISFGNFLFFALHVLLTLGVRHTSQVRRLIHTGALGQRACMQGLDVAVCLPQALLKHVHLSASAAGCHEFGAAGFSAMCVHALRTGRC